MTSEASGQIWVVGRFVSGGNWNFQGAFATEAAAKAACRDDNYFVAPAVIGELLPHETSFWPGITYPLRDSDSS